MKLDPADIDWGVDPTKEEEDLETAMMGALRRGTETPRLPLPSAAPLGRNGIHYRACVSRELYLRHGSRIANFCYALRSPLAISPHTDLSEDYFTVDATTFPQAIDPNVLIDQQCALFTTQRIDVRLITDGDWESAARMVREEIEEQLLTCAR